MPTLILTDIYIWVSGLKHHDKLKAVVKKMNYLSNPTIFAIPRELWLPYHNFIVYSWYNEGFYEWVWRRITSPYSESHLRYKLLGSLSTGITKLNPALIKSRELAVTFQQITRDENSSIPYFKQKILDYDE